MKKSLLSLAAISAGAVSALAQPDYGPAIWRPCCNANWYTSGYGHKFCVIHDMEGYYGSTVSYFTSCSHTSSSVYYAVNGLAGDSGDGSSPAGEISQMVRESYYAWHACCWNQYCFGTEHEGFQSNPAWYTAAMYQASAGLQTHLCSVGGIALDRNHIVGHGEKSNANWVAYCNANFGCSATCNSHTDPGPYWDWNTYMGLITGATGRPFGPLGLNADSRQQVFIFGTDSKIYSSWQTAVNSTTFSGWTDINGQGWQGIPKSLVVGRNADGRLEAFMFGTDNKMYSCWQSVPNGGWGGWANINGQAWAGQGTMAVANNADGRMQLFLIGTDQKIYTCWQTVPNGGWGTWGDVNGSGWQAKAGSTLAVARNQDGRLQLFMTGTDSKVNTCWQVAPNGGWSAWAAINSTGWQALGCSLAVAANQNGCLQLFMIGTDNNVDTCWQTSVNGVFCGWSGMGGSLQDGSLAVGSNQNGALQVFGVKTDNTVSTCFQTAPNGGWSGWGGLGTQLAKTGSRLAVGFSLNGCLELYMNGSDSKFYRCWQIAPNSSWTGWTDVTGQGTTGTL